MGNGSLNAQKKFGPFAESLLLQVNFHCQKRTTMQRKVNVSSFSLFPSLMDSSSRNIRENRRRGTHRSLQVASIVLPFPQNGVGGRQGKQKREEKLDKKSQSRDCSTIFSAIFVGKEFGLMPRFVFTCQLCKCSGEGGEGYFIALLGSKARWEGWKKSRNLD